MSDSTERQHSKPCFNNTPPARAKMGGWIMEIETMKKTVEDAVRWHNGVWPTSNDKVICCWDEQSTYFVYWVKDWINIAGDSYQVCTREQFEKAAREMGYGKSAEWRGEGLPSVGVEVEVLHDGRWIGATTVGEFGDITRYMVCAPNGGGFYAYGSDHIRPLPTDREKWVEAAHKISGVRESQVVWGGALGRIHDAMQSGQLPMPEVKK